MSELSKRAWVSIDLKALTKNLAKVRSLCPQSRIVPVIKADAYGHGMEQAARAIKNSHTKIDAFAVATMNEAISLNELALGIPVMLLPGFASAQEFDLCVEHGIEMVVHSKYQLECLETHYEKGMFDGLPRLWVKHNSGMNRLGFNSTDCVEAFNNLRRFPETELILMSHLAFADDMNNSDSENFTKAQIAEFEKVRGELQSQSRSLLNCSMAASAGILTLEESHYDYVRPGVMLYGTSPLANENGDVLGLLPAMTLHSRIIAINEVKTGDAIGYGATFRCKRDTRVGVVSIGYADGYPRSAANATPVLVQTAQGMLRTQLIGRVSMDMITIDLTGMDDVEIGSEVVLWGKDLCADEVAKMAGTISYELFCKVTGRVEFEYSQ